MESVPYGSGHDEKHFATRLTPLAVERRNDGLKKDIEPISLPPGLDEALLPFQRQAVEFGLKLEGRVLIADQMGCGKTLSSIALAWQYRDEWPLLVITPSSMRGSWAYELERWLPSVSPSDISILRSGKDVKDLDKQIVLVTYGLLTQPLLMESLEAQQYKVRKRVPSRRFVLF